MIWIAYKNSLTDTPTPKTNHEAFSKELPRKWFYFNSTDEQKSLLMVFPIEAKNFLTKFPSLERMTSPTTFLARTACSLKNNSRKKSIP